MLVLVLVLVLEAPPTPRDRAWYTHPCADWTARDRTRTPDARTPNRNVHRSIARAVLRPGPGRPGPPDVDRVERGARGRRPDGRASRRGRRDHLGGPPPRGSSETHGPRGALRSSTCAGRRDGARGLR